MRNLNLISLNNFVGARGTYYGEYGNSFYCAPEECNFFSELNYAWGKCWEFHRCHTHVKQSVFLIIDMKHLSTSKMLLKDYLSNLNGRFILATDVRLQKKL